MLQALRKNLVRLGRGRVLTLFTTREDSVWDDEALRKDWRLLIGSMRASGTALQFRLNALGVVEATALIRYAIPAIETHYSFC
jgi:hypothetical protein